MDTKTLKLTAYPSAVTCDDKMLTHAALFCISGATHLAHGGTGDVIADVKITVDGSTISVFVHDVVCRDGYVRKVTLRKGERFYHAQAEEGREWIIDQFEYRLPEDFEGDEFDVNPLGILAD